MAIHLKNVSEWGSDDVASWLYSINLSHLIPTFERNDITGAALSSINDQFMKETLKISKPAEMAALRGALATLIQQDQTASRKANKTLPKIPIQPTTALRSGRDRAGSAGADAKPTSPKTATMPSRRITDVPVREPQLLIAPARQLLDDHCKHSGWIRKQGGAHRSWKKRYLILRLGCLYYYANETATTPKGQFTLSGYKTKLCDEATIIDKYPWTLEIIPSNPAMRVYYVAAGAKKELESWKAAIDSEIEYYKKSTPIMSSHDRLSPPATSGDGASSEEEDNATVRIYDEPPDSDDSGKGIYVDLVNKEDGESGGNKPINGGIELVPPYLLARSQTTSEVSSGKPRIPERPLPPVSTSVPASQTFVSGDNEDHADGVYLALQEVNNATVSPVPVAKRISNTTAPPPNHKVIVRDNKEIFIPEPNRRDYEDTDIPSDHPAESDDSENPYYILFSSPEEIMPESCVFEQMERDEVDRLLRSKSYNGTYLIREGNHAGTEKVLSVWHIDKCRHYKLFKDEHGMYSLTQGTPFKTIPALLQHYQKQSHLPKSDFYLSVPYT